MLDVAVDCDTLALQASVFFLTRKYILSHTQMGRDMKIFILGCRVLTRELSALIAQSQNQVDVTWIPQGLHDTPSLLHDSLNEQLNMLYRQIDRKMQKRVPDYIVLGYGLCSKAVVGLKAGNIPLVVPKVEDCIGLFLGSQKRYLDYFSEYKGTFWLNSRWIEDCPDLDEDYDDRLREAYMAQYDDEDTVDYLMEMHRDGLKNYRNVGYISTNTFDDRSAREQAARFAADHHLKYLEFEGNNSLLKKIVDGDFDNDSFLIVPPGYQIRYNNETNSIQAGI